jgi:MFS transporter, DHA3 family, macrolide efflux protein
MRGFRTVLRHRLLAFILLTCGIINGTWFAAYFVGLPLMIARDGVTGPGGTGLAAFGLVISAYGSTNVATTLIVGNRGIAQRPHRLIFGGNLFVGAGVIGIGAAPLLFPPWFLLPAFGLFAAFSAIGGPMQDITTATLRQTVLPQPELAAAVRAFMVMNNFGLLLALLVAPTLFDTIGVPAAVMTCGTAMLLVAAAGFARFGIR